MATARAMFDAAKHPRGFHGRFGSGGRGFSVTNVGRKGLNKTEQRDIAAAGKRIFPSHTIPGAETLAYASKKSGRKRAVIKFRPALYTDEKTGKHTEVVGRFRYSTSGAIFKPAGWRPKRAG